jgi:hypothetical protein
MSSVNASTTQSSSPEKKVRAPALSEKYSKFIQFSYYMMSQMSETETFTKEEFLNQVQMFATVDEQQTFIQGFFDNQKDNKKAMRKDIQEKKKASQPKKVRAPRKTKKETTPTPTTTEAQPVADNTNESQENLIENLTTELTEEPMIAPTNDSEVAEEPPMIDKINAAIEVAEDMTSKKPRAKKATTGEKKPRVAKKKQTKEPTTPKLTEADDSP